MTARRTPLPARGWATATIVVATAGLITAPALGAQASESSPIYRQCADSAVSTTVVADDEAAGAGQRLANIVFENTGKTICRLSGAPRVSLVGYGDGTQLGGPAEPSASGAPFTVMLRPGDGAGSALRYTVVTEGGGSFDTACAAQRADGYRIYPPHSSRSVFVPAPQWACSSTVHWGVVHPVDTIATGTNGTGAGCTDPGRVPAGAVIGVTEDVDRDGRADTQFYGASSGRFVYGIRTAAGGVYRITDPLRGLRVHSGWTANLDSAGGTITVIDDQRTAKLYAFRGCRFVPVAHQQGGPYEFAIGGTSTAGTGVACNDRNGGVLLERAAAVKRSNGRYDIVWTTVDVSASGRTAVQDAGTREVRWGNLKATDPRVAQARSSICGTELKVEASQE